MMEPSVDTSEFGDDSQLPDVEEYKASVNHRSPSSSIGGKVMQSLGNVIRSPRDPDAKRLDPPEQTQELLEMEYEEDSLELEQPRLLYKEDAHHDSSTSGRCFWKVCALMSFALLTCIIVLIVMVSTEDDSSVNNLKDDIFHWVHGDTDSYNAVKEYIVNVAQISQASVLEDASRATPQYLAAQWMAHGDGRKLPVPSTVDSEFNERYVIALLYFSMEGPSSWKHQYNFLSEDHVCTWYEEFELQDGTSIIYGVHGCKKDQDDVLHAHRIYMPNNGLNGFIPKEISSLSRLELFNLEFNPAVVGTIPETIGDMNSLTHLALQWCNLDGTIPYWLTRMSNLEYLGLGNNLLDGTVPTEIGLMQRLELLGLDDNDLYGDIEIFRPLVNMKSLYLENNFFSGIVDDALMQSWPNLEEFDVSDCLLTGELSPTLFNHQASLKVADLHGNKFEGPLPDIINENFELEFLALHDNNFTGLVPETFSNFKALKHLDISDNQLVSTMPEKLGELTTLEYLFTGTNNFSPGEIPKFLIELTNLKELSMKKNQLQGSIPPLIEYLSNLKFLDFHGNQLTNEIPNGFGQLTALRHLILKQNLLSGQIPSAFGSMTSMQVLLMEQNRFQGDASPICEATMFEVETFVADCGSDSMDNSTSNTNATDDLGVGLLPSGKITCMCCTMCCDAKDEECNNWDWKGNLDPIWEYGYRRRRYSYDLGPVIFTP